MTKKRSLEECVRNRYHRPGNGLLKTRAEIAAALGESERTILTWWHDGIIPGMVFGHRTVRFLLDDVVKALEERTVKAA